MGKVLQRGTNRYASTALCFWLTPIASSLYLPSGYDYCNIAMV